MNRDQFGFVFISSFFSFFLLFCYQAFADDLIVDGTTVVLGGYHEYDRIEVINGGQIVVATYDGVDKLNRGNLVLRADSIFIDEASSITATGSGYQTVRCGNGQGPYPDSGGRGGCAVRDSGGGGAHFGKGGRGTKDCDVISPSSSCQFPDEFEEDCGNSLSSDGTSCTSRSNCWDFDGLPTVAGQPYYHTIYDVEFGASGGDKGCRDGDGFGSQPLVAGSGGGRIVLVSVSDSSTGSIRIDGTVSADGKRGCGTGNDSGGGGAGGSVIIIGDSVTVGDNAKITATGGLGGDTRGLAGSPDCPPPAQQGGTCDDCGGGGGGGLVAIRALSFSISPTAYFSVDGGAGGVCSICRGEAGGGAGELQLYGKYTAEVCDGYDNDFDGEIDEDQPVLPCGLPSCVDGVAQSCPPDPSCLRPVTDTRARFLIIMDTSASMLTDLSGTPTFGDGSEGHRGIDSNLDGVEGNDSKLFLAKRALSQIISAYPEIDWALARYHQDASPLINCGLAHWVECRGMCCSYDDPRNNVPPPAYPACTLYGGSSGLVDVQMVSPAGEQCINYSGSCGIPRGGADIVAGFNSPTQQYLMWLDGTERNFIPDETPYNYCNWAGGGDCEFRATGPTPLASSIQRAEDFLSEVIGCDGAIPCRRYGVILLTDGAESCGGNPVEAATQLYDHLGVTINVIGFSILPEEVDELNAIALAGSGGMQEAFFVGDEESLANTLAEIIASSFIQELCNGLDDDCDGEVDEDYPSLGAICYDDGIGVCRGEGQMVCTEDGKDTVCEITSFGESPSDEICDGLDNDCDGLVDEDLVCEERCEGEAEVCDGVDNDCDGAVDEDDPMLGAPCGSSSTPPCRLGELLCISGRLICVGAIEPGEEICNCEDEDCDGTIDNDAPCPPGMKCIDCGCRDNCVPTSEFSCPPGYQCTEYEDGWYCIPTECLNCKEGEICVDGECVNPCEGVECAPNETCRYGECFDCYILGCPEGQICLAAQCSFPPCDGVECGEDSSCILGRCVDNCHENDCSEGQVCGAGGRCTDDPCYSVLCEGGRICIDGRCSDDPCYNFTCPIGQICVKGNCVYDLCMGVRCDEGFECEMLPDGSPVCREKGRHEESTAQQAVKEKIAATGGVGVGCSVNPCVSYFPDGRVVFFLILLVASIFLSTIFRRRIP